MSNAKPKAAMAQISHCRGVRRGAAIGGESLSAGRLPRVVWKGSVLIVRLVIVFFLISTVIPFTAAAQTSATMTGRITDSTGAVVPGATITARHLERSVERVAITDAGGRFVIAGLPVGS